MWSLQFSSHSLARLAQRTQQSTEFFVDFYQRNKYVTLDFKLPKRRSALLFWIPDYNEFITLIVSSPNKNNFVTAITVFSQEEHESVFGKLDETQQNTARGRWKEEFCCLVSLVCEKEGERSYRKVCKRLFFCALSEVMDDPKVRNDLRVTIVKAQQMNLSIVAVRVFRQSSGELLEKKLFSAAACFV